MIITNTSNVISLVCGVSHGSVLGSESFTAYIEDILIVFS